MRKPEKCLRYSGVGNRPVLGFALKNRCLGQEGHSCGKINICTVLGSIDRTLKRASIPSLPQKLDQTCLVIKLNVPLDALLALVAS
jgi:hypothetical protein